MGSVAVFWLRSGVVMAILSFPHCVLVGCVVLLCSLPEEGIVCIFGMRKFRHNCLMIYCWYALPGRVARMLFLPTFALLYIVLVGKI